MIARLKVDRVQRHAVQSRWPVALCPGVPGCQNSCAMSTKNSSSPWKCLVSTAGLGRPFREALQRRMLVHAPWNLEHLGS
jgi:hypothetical protein